MPDVKVLYNVACVTCKDNMPIAVPATYGYTCKRCRLTPNQAEYGGAYGKATGTNLCPQAYAEDEDGYSSGWSIIIKAYEETVR